jgi:hypothetical protein
MFVKRGASEDVYDAALQRLRDMAKAILPESQCPAVELSHSPVARLKPAPSRVTGLAFARDRPCLMGDE